MQLLNNLGKKNNIYNNNIYNIVNPTNVTVTVTLLLFMTLF